MHESDWLELAQKMEDALGAKVVDDKTITDAYGASQYLFKSNEVLEIDPFDLCRLDDLMKHVRTHEPQGSFRAMCSDLRRTKMKIIWSQNKLVKVRRSDGSLQGQSAVISGDGDERTDSTTASVPGQFGERQPVTNHLLRITVPIARATRVKEPQLLLLNFNGDFSGFLAENPKLAKFRAELMPQWINGTNTVAAPPNVHCTVQVSDQPVQCEQHMADDGDDLNGLIEPEIFEGDEASFPV
jgi:hypothetical protein